MDLPLTCVPHGAWQIFLFALVCSLLIYGPILLLFVVYFNTGSWSAGVLIITAFGLVFGSIFRGIAAGFTHLVHMDRHQLTLTTYGFYEKVVAEFEQRDWVGIVVYRQKYRGTKNHKVCLQLKDGRQVMLELTIFKGRARRFAQNYSMAMGLKEIDPQKRQIINDGQLTVSN